MKIVFVCYNYSPRHSISWWGVWNEFWNETLLWLLMKILDLINSDDDEHLLFEVKVVNKDFNSIAILKPNKWSSPNVSKLFAVFLTNSQIKRCTLMKNYYWSKITSSCHNFFYYFVLDLHSEPFLFKNS